MLVTACAQSQEELRKFFVDPHELSPTNIQVDFDGDGVVDKVVLTGLKGSAIDLPKTTKLVHPWAYDKNMANMADLAVGSKTNFYIVLSKTSASYVIHDANLISILDTEAAQELFVVKGNELSDNGLSDLKNEARGDLLGIPTEAGIDTYLYWNGATIASYEPLEIP
jgi:hypothetical protein